MTCYEGKMYSDRQNSPIHWSYVQNFDEKDKFKDSRIKKVNERREKIYCKNFFNMNSIKGTKKDKCHVDEENQIKQRRSNCPVKEEREGKRVSKDIAERLLYCTKPTNENKELYEETDKENNRKNNKEIQLTTKKRSKEDTSKTYSSCASTPRTSYYSISGLTESTCVNSLQGGDEKEEEEVQEDEKKEKDGILRYKSQEKDVEKKGEINNQEDNKLKERKEETGEKKKSKNEEDKEIKNQQKIVGMSYYKRLNEKNVRYKRRSPKSSNNKRRKDMDSVNTYKASHKYRKMRERESSVDSLSTSPSDYERDVEVSRSRERQRIQKQYLTIQKYCKTNESQVFWDGFQWVNKGEGGMAYDQQMNATRRARRLHIGNLPLFMSVKESDFRNFLWQSMRLNNFCEDEYVCPILHIWFARDRGGNFGFMEMQTVEDAHNALKLDGILWNGVPIRINRPTDWKKTVSTHAIDVLASTSNLAVAESLAAAAQQAATTGNSTGLVSLVNQLPVQQQHAIVEVMNQHILPNFQERNTNASLPLDFLREKIKVDLLNGPPSRVVRIVKPSIDLDSMEEYDEVLNDIKDECVKYGSIMRALIISPSIKQKLFSVLTDVGDVFFEFATTLQADNCILNMSGRMYDKKPVKMIRFDEAVYVEKLMQFSQNFFIEVLKETE